MKFLILFISVLILIVSCSEKPVQIPDEIPKFETFTIDSKELGEKRVINVWTPKNYKENSKHFPVLYMPDGGIKEDFPHIANTLSKLIDEKKIPPYILVGIENTDRRKDLTGFSQSEDDEQYAPLSDGATHFRTFISDELFPEIELKYRAVGYTGIIGESLAGLFVTETFLKRPEIFDFFIAFDPSLWWDNHSLVKNVEEKLQNLPNREIKYWFAGSDAEDIYKYTRKLKDELTIHAPNNLIWNYSDEPNEQHNTIFRSAKEKALIWILNNKVE